MRDWIRTVGKTDLFYGSVGTRFRFGDEIWEVVDTEYQDGWGTNLKTVRKIQGPILALKDPLAIVTVTWIQTTRTSTFALIDGEHNSHPWLQFGTHNHSTDNGLEHVFHYTYNPLKLPEPTPVQIHRPDSYDHLFNPRPE